MLVIWIAALLLSFNDSPPITPENVTRIEVIARIEVVTRLEVLDPYVEKLVFNPVNSHELLMLRTDGLVSIWDVRSAYRRYEWRPTETILNDIAYTSDGRYIITAADDGNVTLWNSVTYALVKTLNLPDQIPVVLDTAPNNIIAVGYRDGNVRLWDSTAGTSLVTLYGRGAIQMLAISPDGSRVAFAAFTMVMLYRIENIAQEKIYIEGSFNIKTAGNIRDLDFHPNPPFPPFFESSVIVTIGSHMGTRFWGLPFPIGEPYLTSASTMEYPYALSLNHDGSLIAVGGKATAAGGGCNTNLCPIEIIRTRFDPNDLENLFPVAVKLVGPQTGPIDVTFSSDDRYLASSFDNGSVLIWGIPPR